MTDVFVAACDGYPGRRLETRVAALLDRAAGSLSLSGLRVLIKPNFLLPAPPEKAVTTHPLVVRAAAAWVLDRGGRPTIMDSPALHSVRRVWKEGGYAAAMEGMGVPFGEFEAGVERDIGPPFGRAALAREAVEADLVVNLAKLKTHSQMGLTLGVKNTFGCVVGLAKAEWHMRAGADRDRFARLLVQVHRAVAPALSLVDGVLAMEGDGPGKGGRPRHVGALLCGRDAVAVDEAVCGIVGLPPDRLPTHRAAVDLGCREAEPRIHGDRLRSGRFHIPQPAQLLFGPPLLRQWLRRHLVQRPVTTDEDCRGCGECVRICPAGAVSETGRRLDFDYDRCIRCYCCVEICPHGVLRARDPLPGRLVRRWFRGRFPTR
jgi:uncharacterized protein (DUF362 family)/Pyruvate/2-oxoacid:ferredoxin oxidoreductase delta subunit